MAAPVTKMEPSSAYRTAPASEYAMVVNRPEPPAGFSPVLRRRNDPVP
jgi:hypothetical protein